MTNEMPRRFYHGSSKALPLGTVLVGRGDAYEHDWCHTDFYDILEKHRPDGQLSHKEAVFMVGEVDDVDLAGGATDWCFEVLPQGKVTKHDLNWSSQISCLIGDGASPDHPDIKECALNYWSGKPHPDESVWEYITPSAAILRCEPYDEFAVSAGQVIGLGSGSNPVPELKQARMRP